MPKLSVSRLVLWPAVFTLAVTVLRLTGELLGWSPRLFNREAGGGAALVGIVWLVFVFGIYFALRLAHAGEVPARLGPAAGWSALALLLFMASIPAAFALFRANPVAQLGLFFVASWLAVAVARRGWPELWRTLLVYSVFARLPVLLIMLFAIFGGWDTHYAKPRPDFPPMGPWGLFFWTALLPQMSIWLAFTVTFGMIMGVGTIAIQRLLGRRAAVPARSPAA